jgi:uncharacterized protein YaaN involved in tellurite resistance
MHMTTPTASKLKINFDALVASKPAALPAGQAAIGSLMTMKQGSIEPIDITRDLLSEEDRRAARAAATQLYPLVRDNRTFRGQWGDEVLEPLNALVSMILKERGRVEYGDVDQYIREMNDAVDNFRRKHSANDSQLQQRLTALWKAASNLVGDLKRFARDLYQDSLTTEQQLDRVAGKLVKRKDQLEQNVEYCAQLIEKNEEACTALIGVIAVMEQVIVLAEEEGTRLEAEMVSLPEGSTDRRDKSRELETVMQLKSDYEKRISAFVQRLSIAWTTTPQVEKIQSLSYQLAQRLGLLITLTIPVLKLVVVQLGFLADAQKASDSIARIDDATNAAIDMYSNQSVEVSTQVARQVETTSLRPDTILRMMEAVVRVNNNILEAEAYGRQQRAEIAQAVQQGYLAIVGSQEDLQQARLAAFKAAQQPLALPAAPAVPEEVTQYAVEQGLAA